MKQAHAVPNITEEEIDSLFAIWDFEKEKFLQEDIFDLDPSHLLAYKDHVETEDQETYESYKDNYEDFYV